MICKYIKKDGTQCQSKALKGSEYCFFHSPEHEKERKEAQKKGGEQTGVLIPTGLDPVELNEAQDIVTLLSETINKVRLGEMDVKVANCIGFLSNHLIKAIELTSVSQRVEIIERAILERRTTIN